MKHALANPFSSPSTPPTGGARQADFDAAWVRELLRTTPDLLAEVEGFAVACRKLHYGPRILGLTLQKEVTALVRGHVASDELTAATRRLAQVDWTKLAEPYYGPLETRYILPPEGQPAPERRTPRASGAVSVPEPSPRKLVLAPAPKEPDGGHPYRGGAPPALPAPAPSLAASASLARVTTRSKPQPTIGRALRVIARGMVLLVQALVALTRS